MLESLVAIRWLFAVQLSLAHGVLQRGGNSQLGKPIIKEHSQVRPYVLGFLNYGTR